VSQLNPTKKSWRERTRSVWLVDQHDIDAARSAGYKIPERLGLFPLVSLGPFPTEKAQEINKRINDLSNKSRQQASREEREARRVKAQA